MLLPPAAPAPAAAPAAPAAVAAAAAAATVAATATPTIAPVDKIGGGGGGSGGERVILVKFVITVTLKSRPYSLIYQATPAPVPKTSSTVSVVDRDLK